MQKPSLISERLTKFIEPSFWVSHGHVQCSKITQGHLHRDLTHVVTPGRSQRQSPAFAHEVLTGVAPHCPWTHTPRTSIYIYIYIYIQIIKKVDLGEHMGLYVLSALHSFYFLLV